MADFRSEEQGHEMVSAPSSSSPTPKASGKMHKQNQQSVVSQGKGIVIHLTSPPRSGDWESSERSKQTGSMAREDDGMTATVGEEENLPYSEECLNLPASSLPSSPSISGFLGELFFPTVSSPSPSSVDSCTSSETMPLISLVKSLSTEIESRETSSLRPKPLLSLVKSLSTEISRHEPEVTQSKSDSKLNLYLWRQLTQPKGRNGDSKTAPPSPLFSPTESKISFFNVPEVEAKLEDTKRKFSEAIQEPLNMLSKIIGDESSGSPKSKASQSNTWSTDSYCAPGSEDCSSDLCTKNRRSGFDRFRMEKLKSGKRENDRSSNTEASPGRHTKGKQKKQCLSLTQAYGDNNNPRYEICSDGDVLQIVETQPSEDSTLCGQGAMYSYSSRALTPLQPPPEVPSKTLMCFVTLAYSYFVLPLPPFFSGLCLGLACGFLMGLLIISLQTPRFSQPGHLIHLANENLQMANIIREPKDPEGVKGWMNEIYNYDPETYLPSLTFSVYVTLDGTALKLSYPRSNISRRATFDEGKHDVEFISHRSCDLADSKVFLVPPGLAKKRMWNKKYPICIFLREAEPYKFKRSGDRELKTDMDTEEQRARPEIMRQVSTPEVLLRHPVEGGENALFLFGRTGREKEEWFRYFLLASRMQSEDGQNLSRDGGKPDPTQNLASSPLGRLVHSNGSSRDSTEDLPPLFKTKDLAGNIRQKIQLDYSTYMSKLTLSDSPSPMLSPEHSTTSSPTKNQMPGDDRVSTETEVSWINAVVGRIFWDFLREKYWADQVACKVQKKLSKIKLPYFMNELTLTELDMGTLLPVVVRASSPSVNQKGLWVDLEIVYNGALQMTLETKMNLGKLGKESVPEGLRLAGTRTEGLKPRTFVLADSDEESSSAGSSDEEEMPSAEPQQGTIGEKLGPTGAEGHTAGGSTSRKILRFVDKIAKSKYFQKATENEFIKKKIEEVSNTPLLLTVEVQELAGILAVNIPPPPTDRIWYSFRTPPRLEFKVRPKLGDREVTFTHVTEWIEKKLQHEFQKVFVMPNMDDIYIPIMHSGLDKPDQPKQSLGEATTDASFDSTDRF
ncbi:testis-expressed protein 2 isoform X1 [Scyliorhinus canicula]|uniref:testis-expressed protein 2 isoform X1 n=1 Tax=Scyliorhinus canicula TaxID=7830 RepID=UPI0018F5552E|nr:testis-expressed protein 2 isoform X1 [Scyliorhinus canicula]XP_038676211.1 testis-expressed protein 2 isoform X1 [Scyliorhinus canicula]